MKSPSSTAVREKVWAAWCSRWNGGGTVSGHELVCRCSGCLYGRWEVIEAGGLPAEQDWARCAVLDALRDGDLPAAGTLDNATDDELYKIWLDRFTVHETISGDRIPAARKAYTDVAAMLKNRKMPQCIRESLETEESH